MSKNVIDLAPRTFIFVALPCEAKPLIQAWQLKKPAGKQTFAMHRNADTAVVVSGIGKIAMAGAVAYTMAQFRDVHQPILLNLGVAGHRHQSVGNCLLADKIIDAESGRRFYPQLPFKTTCPTSALETSVKANTDYSTDCLHDMEASAFYEMAVKFGSSELIHCFKVVSDNAHSPVENIDGQAVAHWIEAGLANLEQFLTELLKLRQIPPALNSRACEELLNRFHFSASNATKLQTLLSRWLLLKPDAPIELDFFDGKNGKALIAWMERELDNTQFYL